MTRNQKADATVDVVRAFEEIASALERQLARVALHTSVASNNE